MGYILIKIIMKTIQHGSRCCVVHYNLKEFSSMIVSPDIAIFKIQKQNVIFTSKNSFKAFTDTIKNRVNYKISSYFLHHISIQSLAF